MEKTAKPLFLMWAVYIYNPTSNNQWQKWILLEELERGQEWNKILFPRIVSDQGIAAHTKYVALDSVLEGVFHNATYQQK